MKLLIISIISALALSACSTTDPNQKAAQQKVLNAAEQAAINAALDAAVEAADQYGTSGKVDTKKLAADALKQAASDLKASSSPAPAAGSAK